MWESKCVFPHHEYEWYRAAMSEASTHAITIGDRGRFVLPADIRERHGWQTGTSLVAIDTDTGLLVMSVEEGLAWLRQRTEGRDLVGELLEERRSEVETDLA